MATSLYNLARENFLKCTSAYSWTSANIQLAFVTSSYSPNYNTDQYLSDISAGFIVAQSGNFTSTTATLGIADAADETVSSVSGSTFSYVTIYYSTGVSSSSGLILNIDTATGLPCTPNGGNIVVQWDNGTYKIFQLKEAHQLDAWDTVKYAIMRRFGAPILDRTYSGRAWAGVPTMHVLPATAEQAEVHRLWQRLNRLEREVAGRRITPREAFMRERLRAEWQTGRRHLLIGV